jgi:small subunit ribosomal protein S1
LNRRKVELAERLVEGAEVVGKVKNLTDYGVFVDLGGIDGLLHITDLSWGRIGHPSEVVQVGQEIRVKVLKHDPEKGRISLGLKQLTSDPWESVPMTYHAGDRVAGRVVSLADYGAFVELEPGVEGLIHISEMSWSKRLRHPSKILKLEDRMEVGVLDVDPVKRRISLSLKTTLPDPWTLVGDRFAVGSMVHGRVAVLAVFWGIVLAGALWALRDFFLRLTRYIGNILQQHHGNVSHAAATLRISRTALQKKMKRYGLR